MTLPPNPDLRPDSEDYMRGLPDRYREVVHEAAVLLGQSHRHIAMRSISDDYPAPDMWPDDYIEQNTPSAELARIVRAAATLYAAENGHVNTGRSFRKAQARIRATA